MRHTILTGFCLGENEDGMCITLMTLEALFLLALSEDRRRTHIDISAIFFWLTSAIGMSKFLLEYPR